MRSDLVMVGRILLIRPVRHFIRGAYFARTYDRYAFETRQYLHPLFHTDSELGARHPVGYPCIVYEPQVEYLVFDSLAHRVFDDWSRLTAFSDIIDEAHKNNLRVAVHATDPPEAKGLLRAGIDVFAYDQ